MRGIALKIFVSFWLIFAVLIATFALLPAPRESFRFLDHLRLVGTVASTIRSERGAEACSEYSEMVARTAGIRFVLLDAAGTVVCGGAAMGASARTVALSDPVGLNLTVAGEQLPAFDAARNPPPFPYRDVVFAILISGLVCYATARYLARPIQLVRDASNRLAAGDLHARAGPIGRNRNDEIGDLVRDFDVMAVRLEALVDTQQQLLTDISHELRSPLARLNVALELARRNLGSEGASELRRIEMEADRMNELIGHVLTLARTERALRGSETPIDLNAVAAQVVSDANYEAQRHEKSVALVENSSVRIQGVAQLLASAIDNVVRNAVRHTVSHSVVVVSVTKTATDAIVSVADRGPGVPESELEKIFMPFHRVDSGRNREAGGVGLGLSIARRAIAIHGGVITAENRDDGGLAVVIRLPLTRVNS